jgi:glycosyltransferase involved in cell wall biosynthesis
MLISVVTVARNRTEHLLACAQHVASSSLHEEHLILDFGSSQPVDRSQLPGDSRIRLVRVEWDQGWWLTHAYNLAFSLARGDFILKLDADVLLPDSFLNALWKRQQLKDADLMCGRLTVQDWKLPSTHFGTNGLFFCRASCLRDLGGFNPYIRGWGWDEMDLYSRFFLAGYSVACLPEEEVCCFDHGDAERVDLVCSTRLNPSRVKKAINQKNMDVAVQAVLQQLSWPDFDAYACFYGVEQAMPPLPRINLIKDAVLLRLLRRCITTLYRPGAVRQKLWTLLARMGLGPYAPKRAMTLLRRCGIDLDLVVQSPAS